MKIRLTKAYRIRYEAGSVLDLSDDYARQLIGLTVAQAVPVEPIYPADDSDMKVVKKPAAKKPAAKKKGA